MKFQRFKKKINKEGAIFCPFMIFQKFPSYKNIPNSIEKRYFSALFSNLIKQRKARESLNLKIRAVPSRSNMVFPLVHDISKSSKLFFKRLLLLKRLCKIRWSMLRWGEWEELDSVKIKASHSKSLCIVALQNMTSSLVILQNQVTFFRNFFYDICQNYSLKYKL